MAVVELLALFLVEALLVEAVGVQVGGPQILGTVLVGHGLVKVAWAASLATSSWEVLEVFIVQGLLGVYIIEDYI